MSTSTHELVAVTTDINVGNTLARLIGLSDGDALTFTKGVPLRLIGGDGSVVAWGATPLLTSRGALLVSEFNGDAPYPELTALGATPELIAVGKAHVYCEMAERGTGRSALEVYASLGHEPAVERLLPLPPITEAG